MKVARAEERVLGSHGLEQTSTFRIKTNAHAFRMLSSGLYSDKIAAVLREIACNAADAHTEYGTPERPIEVKLPNRIDNQFYIRDYGPGLSHEAVMHLYTTYFESSKQNSNDFTGAFGLGSKSPFSYVDQFSITAVHGGVKRTYSAYIGNDGSPTISLLTEETPDTGWEHGVQIGFPVKPEDFSQFQTRAGDIYRWFKVTPLISGSKQVDKAAISFENDHMMVVKGLPGHGVVMGNVFYPLDFSKLGDMRGEPRAQIVGQFPGLVLKLKIGQVMVAASREHLEYDKGSIRALLDALIDASTFIKDDVVDRLKGADTWAKKCALRKSGDLWLPEAFGYGRSNVYEGLFLAHDLGPVAAKEMAEALVGNQQALPRSAGATAYAKVVETTYRGARAYRVEQGNRVGKDGDWDGKATLEYNMKTAVAYGLRNLSLAKAKYAIDNGTYRQLVVLSPMKGTDLALAKKEAENVARDMGLDAPIDLASLPLPPGYTAKTKGQRKAKGATLKPLPPTERFRVYTTSGRSVELPADQAPESFMVYGGKGARIYEKSDDQDKSMNWQHWEMLWKNSQLIASTIGLTAHTSYTMLRPSKVIQFELVKRGWRPTYQVMHDWLADKTTSDKLAKVLAAWRPSAALRDYGGGQGMVLELLWLQQTKPDVYNAAVRPLLTPPDVKALDELLAHSIAMGDKAGQNQPPELAAWDTLAAEFKLTPLRAPRGRFLTVNDLEKHVRNQYPVMQAVAAEEMRAVLNRSPDRFEEFMKFLLRR